MEFLFHQSLNLQFCRKIQKKCKLNYTVSLVVITKTIFDSNLFFRYIYPQYETLEGVTTKASNYDSAVESGLDHSDSDTSPNSSFSEKSNVKAEFV